MIKKISSFFPLGFYLYDLGFPCLRKDPCSARPLEGLKIVDVGCGGGILSEVYILSIFLQCWISGILCSVFGF